MRLAVFSCLLLLAVPAAAQTTVAATPPFLAAEGTAEVRVAPDRATVRFGVQHQAKDAKQAQLKVNQVMQNLMQALRKSGIPAERITTERLELQPVYDHQQRPEQPWEGPRLVGFRAANVVRVELPVEQGKGDLVGSVIDTAIGAGANTVEGIEFQLVDDQPAYLRAMQQASQRASEKADQLAKSLGVTRGRLLEARESGVSFEPPVPYMMMEARAMKSAGTSVSPGEMVVRASVVVRYEARAK
jgi:uncharacterized protein YggE